MSNKSGGGGGVSDVPAPLRKENRGERPRAEDGHGECLGVARASDAALMEIYLRILETYVDLAWRASSTAIAVVGAS